MADDLIDDMLGKDRGTAPPENAYRICVHERCVNSVEAEVKERLSRRMRGVLTELPVIFIDEATGELDTPSDGRPEPWAAYFDGRIPKPWEVADLAKDITALEARILDEAGYFQRIAIARALGPRGTMEQYNEACKKAGLEP
jgi:hypothetical protein